MTSDEAAATERQHRRQGRAAGRSTPAWRTRRGCTTTCSAARTTTPPTGRPPRQRSRSTRTRPSPPGEPGVPRPRRPLPGRGGGDPAVPRHRHRHPDGGQHPRGRAGDRAGVPGRLRGLRPDRARARPRAARPAARRAPPSTSTPTCATRHDPRPGRASCSTSPGRWRSRWSRSCTRYPDADDPHAIVATLMDAVPPGSYLAISHLGSDLLEPGEARRHRGAFRGPDDAAADHYAAPASRWRGSSKAPTWSSRDSSESSSGGRSRVPTARSSRPCGAPSAASADSAHGRPLAGQASSSSRCPA